MLPDIFKNTSISQSTNNNNDKNEIDKDLKKFIKNNTPLKSKNGVKPKKNKRKTKSSKKEKERKKKQTIKNKKENIK